MMQSKACNLRREAESYKLKTNLGMKGNFASGPKSLFRDLSNRSSLEQVGFADTMIVAHYSNHKQAENNDGTE